MDDIEMKKKVAAEIMALMDQKDGERLKKHPKLMASMPTEEKDPMAMPEEEESETPNPLGEMASVESEEELSPEMIEKLMEMMSGK